MALAQHWLWRSGIVQLALLLALLAGAPTAYQARYRGRIFPGVRIAGVAVGGQRPDVALARLRQAGLRPDATLALELGEETIERPAVSFGIVWDEAATIEAAYRLGRSGRRAIAFGQALRARLFGANVQPVVTFDRQRAEAALAQLAAEYDRLPEDAALAIDGNQVTLRPATRGRRLVQAAALETLTRVASAGVWPPLVAVLPVETVEPVVREAGRAARQAQRLLAAPITLRAANRSWALTPGELGPMLRINHESGQVVLELDRERLVLWLTPIAEAVHRPARNPRFHFDPEDKELLLLEAGQVGVRLDVAGTAAAILAAADAPGRSVQVVVERIPPQVADDATAAELGIREIVREETSRFVGSPPERIHNIGVAAARFHGLLIPPDAIFSFNENLGEVTAEAGYQKTKIIMDGATRDGFGGGICQVSTTLFRAAFWAGLPIIERMAHGYRVPYYEQGAPVGLDATVFLPSPDLRIQNDTGHWILIETSSDPRRATVTFRLLGTSPGREVRLEGPVISNVVPPPPPKTVIDPSLPPGKTNEIELARSGATVVVTRTVVFPNGEEKKEVFRSHYRPTGAITAVGPSPAGATGDSEAPSQGTTGTAGVAQGTATP